MTVNVSVDCMFISKEYMEKSRDIVSQGPKSWPKVAIVVLNWNRWQDTVECVRSLYHLTYPNYEVVVVDNASTDGSVAHIQEECRNVTIIRTQSNLGYTGGNNVGIQFALEHGAELIMILNNDTVVVSPNLIESLLEVKSFLPNCGIVAPRVCLFEKPNRCLDQAPYPLWWRLIDRFLLPLLLKRAGFRVGPVAKNIIDLTNHAFDQKIVGTFLHQGNGLSEGRTIEVVSHVPGCALGLFRDMIEKVGFFDERLFMYDEEHDLCFRALMSGFFIVRVKDVVVLRKDGGRPLSDKQACVAYYSARNRFFVAAKFPLWPRALLIMLHVFSMLKLIPRLVIRKRWAHVGAVFAGLKDGLQGKTGQVKDTQFTWFQSKKGD